MCVGLTQGANSRLTQGAEDLVPLLGSRREQWQAHVGSRKFVRLT